MCFIDWVRGVRLGQTEAEFLIQSCNFLHLPNMRNYFRYHSTCCCKDDQSWIFTIDRNVGVNCSSPETGFHLKFKWSFDISCSSVQACNASFLKGQGHQGIFSLVKGTLWGNRKYLLEHFKGTKAMTRGHGGNRLCCLCVVSGLDVSQMGVCVLYGHPVLNIQPCFCLKTSFHGKCLNWQQGVWKSRIIYFHNWGVSRISKVNFAVVEYKAIQFSN